MPSDKTDTPDIAQKAPFPVEVREGKTYFWCSCGKSSRQPFCDGSHAGTGFAPVKYTAEKDGKAFFCGCKHTDKAPLCDGSHASL
ncbi:CDGSH iron-sulfur domain-containing protein [Phaeobacter italicus]|uniref:CDGSH iron-sulfur domain-containing protein n=1 Tax=Phaeobacter italicus TaxID=481446 RepID=UPI001C973B87|nr:CDGSH iron-sulfur domain-containing protein [Phaeobacter italicus]MBY5976582.1 CDGSH iron-sulfur domain-containing protein [Phaeobacter italicus]MEC8573575.1 CDGSH iron-sulfur domain-containing protein [Pseudomonadota bacterium]